MSQKSSGSFWDDPSFRSCLEVSIFMKKYTLKLSPYPVTLKLVLSDKLPDKDAFGLTSLEDGGIVLV